MCNYVGVCSPDIKVDFICRPITGPECHSISLLPPRHYCTIDGIAALNESTDHCQQLREGE